MYLRHCLNLKLFPRAPIDSVKDKQDVVGFYSHCVTLKFSNGTVFKQDIYPGSTHCQEIFLQSWKALLDSEWKQVNVISLEKLS